MFIVGRATSGAGAAGITNGAMRLIGVSSRRKERSFLEAAGALLMGESHPTPDDVQGNLTFLTLMQVAALWRARF